MKPMGSQGFAFNQKPWGALQGRTLHTGCGLQGSVGPNTTTQSWAEVPWSPETWSPQVGLVKDSMEPWDPDLGPQSQKEAEQCLGAPVPACRTGQKWVHGPRAPIQSHRAGWGQCSLDPSMQAQSWDTGSTLALRPAPHHSFGPRGRKVENHFALNLYNLQTMAQHTSIPCICCSLCITIVMFLVCMVYHMYLVYKTKLWK